MRRPYDGLFLPYQSEWLNLGPINAGLEQVCTALVPPLLPCVS